MRQVYLFGIHGIANDWVTDRSLILLDEWLNVQSGHSKGSTAVDPSCAPLGLGSLKR